MKLYPVLVASLLAVAVFTADIMAAGNAPSVGPEIIKFKMGDLYLNFRHWQHQKWSNNECSKCHTTKEWKINNWDNESAHQICISCHDLNKKGPVTCTACHGSSRLSRLVGQ